MSVDCSIPLPTFILFRRDAEIGDFLPLVMRNMATGGKATYRPRPDLTFLKDGYPRILGEIDSHSDKADRVRLFASLNWYLRTAYTFGRHTEDFFLLGLYFHRDHKVERILYFQAPSGRK